MGQLLYGPAQAYRVRLRVYAAAEGRRERLLLQTERGTLREDATAETPAYFVAAAGVGSGTLQLRAEGLALQGLRLSVPGPVAVMAAVTALPPAPPWLPASAEYQLFEGDAAAAEKESLLFVPFRHRAAAPDTADRVAVDNLVHALGYSIARANARLAALPAPGGVGLAASLQVRVGVRSFRLGPGEQVIIALARSDERPEQFLEVTLATSPDASADPGAEPGGGGGGR